MIFEILAAEPGHAAPQLLDRALLDALDPSARPLALRLASEMLTTATSALTRRVMLRVLEKHGTSDQLPVVRSFASNALVADDLRTLAAEVARTLEGRR